MRVFAAMGYLSHGSGCVNETSEGWLTATGSIRLRAFRYAKGAPLRMTRMRSCG